MLLWVSALYWLGGLSQSDIDGRRKRGRVVLWGLFLTNLLFIAVTPVLGERAVSVPDDWKMKSELWKKITHGSSLQHPGAVTFNNAGLSSCSRVFSTRDLKKRIYWFLKRKKRNTSSKNIYSVFLQLVLNYMKHKESPTAVLFAHSHQPTNGSPWWRLRLSCRVCSGTVFGPFPQDTTHR